MTSLAQQRQLFCERLAALQELMGAVALEMGVKKMSHRPGDRRVLSPYRTCTKMGHLLAALGYSTAMASFLSACPVT